MSPNVLGPFLTRRATRLLLWQRAHDFVYQPGGTVDFGVAAPCRTAQRRRREAPWEGGAKGPGGWGVAPGPRAEREVSKSVRRSLARKWRAGGSNQGAVACGTWVRAGG